MIWILFFQGLLSCTSGVSSQPTLTQPPSESVSLGQTVKLPCTISSNPNTVRWVQKRPGQIHRGVHCDACGSSRGPGISDRFTATRSGSVGYLTITNIQADDEAEYYCFMWYGSTIIFGGGTQLSINDPSQPKVPPTINLYPPARDEVRRSRRSPGSQEATLVCLINGFYPRDVEISWEANGRPISSGVENTKPTKQNGKYLASSYLSLPPSEWESDNSYTCKVQHDNKSYSKSIKRSDCA